MGQWFVFEGFGVVCQPLFKSGTCEANVLLWGRHFCGNNCLIDNVFCKAMTIQWAVSFCFFWAAACSFIGVGRVGFENAFIMSADYVVYVFHA